jgi:2-polyprenyl-6-methoxyphenol hydroxylase-like FAD-dependent oxidoreductase
MAMSADQGFRVIVVGAGIGGLTAAVALHAAGHHVTVVERAPGLAEVGGHLGVQSNAALALRRLGLDSAVLAAGVPVERFELSSWSGRRLAWWSPGELGREFDAPNVTVPRHVLLAALADGASGLPIHFADPLVGLEEDEHEVVVRLRSGHELRADLVVGADGIRSTVRRLLGLPGEPRDAGYMSWRARTTIRPDELDAGLARHYLGHDRTFGCWPLPDGGTYWVATQLHRTPGPAAKPDNASAEAAHRALVDIFADANPTVRALLAATRADDLLSQPVEAIVGVDAWFTRRVVLIGDAVHAMEPTTGQGAAQAMLDALCLADQLSDVTHATPAADLRRALDRYVAARREPTAAIAKEASGIGKMHHVGNPMGRIVRDMVLRCTPHRVWQNRTRLRLAEAELLGVRPAAQGASR